MSLIEAFGQDWSDKHEANKAVSTSTNRGIAIEGGLRLSIIKTVKAKMKPDQPQLMYPTENDYFHILLVQAFPTFSIKSSSYGFRINFKWDKKWLSATMSNVLSKAIKANEHYILVGKLAVKQGNKPGIEFNNFSTFGIISMQEIAEYKGDIDGGEEGKA